MVVGHAFTTEPFEVTAIDIVDFARLWDPQPFHVSEDAARASPFGGLVGSGLHSLCILVKLGTESGFLTENAIAGLAIESLRFRSPLKPETRVVAGFVVKSARPSNKDRSRAIATIAASLQEVDGPVIITADLVNLYTEGRFKV